MKSVLGTHRGCASRKFVVFHTPPDPASTYTVFGSVGSGRMPRNRPLLTFWSVTPFCILFEPVGPRLRHELGLGAPVTKCRGYWDRALTASSKTRRAKSCRKSPPYSSRSHS